MNLISSLKNSYTYIQNVLRGYSSLAGQKNRFFLHILQVFGIENMSVERFSSIRNINKVITPVRIWCSARARQSSRATHNRALCRHNLSVKVG